MSRLSYSLLFLVLALSLFVMVRSEEAELRKESERVITSLSPAQGSVSLEYNNDIQDSMIFLQVKVSNIKNLPAGEPAMIDLSLNYEFASDPPEYRLILVLPIVLENNKDVSVYQSFQTCDPTYAPTLGESHTYNNKVGLWKANAFRVETQTQEAFSANLEVVLGSVNTHLSQSMETYMTTLMTPVTYFSIPLSDTSERWSLKFYIRGDSPITWLKGLVMRKDECPMFTQTHVPLGGVDQTVTAAAITSGEQSFTVFYSDLAAGDYHIAVQTDGTVDHTVYLSWTADEIIDEEIDNNFWDTENIVLAVLFGLGLLIVVSGAVIALYWYNVRNAKRLEYESL